MVHDSTEHPCMRHSSLNKACPVFIKPPIETFESPAAAFVSNTTEQWLVKRENLITLTPKVKGGHNVNGKQRF